MALSILVVPFQTMRLLLLVGLTELHAVPQMLNVDVGESIDGKFVDLSERAIDRKREKLLEDKRGREIQIGTVDHQ